MWKQLFVQYYLPQKKLLIPLIVLALLTALTDASFAYLIKLVIDEVVAHGTESQLWGHGVAFIGISTLLALSIRGFITISGKLSVELMYELRKSCFNHLQKLSFSFYDKHAVGWLVSRVTSDCERVSNILAWGTLNIFWGGPLILGTFAIMLFLHWKLALMVMAIFPLMVALSHYFRKKILKSSRSVRQTNSRLTAVFNESIAGVQTSKILVREQENLKEFKMDSSKMHQLSKQNLLQSSAFFPLVMVLASLGTGMALWGGGSYVAGGAMTLGTLVAFITYSRDISDPLLDVAETVSDVQQLKASAERIFGLLEVVPEIQDSEEVLQKLKQNYDFPKAADGGESTIETIEFKNATFGYDSDLPVLDKFNLSVKAGQTVALVGPTGGGKSTIVNLLCRFYEPNAGQILLNQTDYRDRSLDWLHSNLGIVLQTPFLFSGSVRENIRYGNLEASDSEVIEAAKAVRVHDIIESLEHGYDTDVGEGGSRLSTGEKQLISFARAIIANPQIFVMDEATSSVDTQTEHLIQKGLQKVLENRTSFIIAHRLSTIRSADHILVIENGVLQEKGNHNELLEKRGKYYDLVQKQFN